MNKRKNQQLNIRNKLFAAIAMLLVSSIMMVSTTYAWFTLSTAPEVQGITTTVGANGALEIALSPMSGNPADIKSNVGDAYSVTGSWFKTNTTWGNLLNMDDPSYELGSITMMPALPELAGGKINTTNPLARPAYGFDGRVSKLVSDTLVGGKVMELKQGETDETLSTGFRVLGESDQGYGVRAVGTTSGMTPNQSAFNSGLSQLRSGMTGAATAASRGLMDNGNALANALVGNALGTVTDYAEFVPAIKSLTASLSNSLTQLDSAIKGAMKAGVAATKTGTEMTTAIEAIDNGDIADLASYASGVSGLSEVINARNALASNITAAQSAANGLPATNVPWTGNDGQVGIYDAVKYLMKTDGNVTVNGKTIDEVKNMMGSEDGLDGDFVSSILERVDIKLGAGSGVYYDIHALASKVSAATKVSVNGAPLGMNTTITLNASINTVYEGTTALGAAIAVVSGMTPKDDTTNTVAMLDVFYGYILDFMFRTNASDSFLQLQTEGVNRVYEEGGAEATMGNGSTITFNTAYKADTDVNGDDAVTDADIIEIDPTIVKGLVDGIRLFFFDTVTGEVFAVARATSVETDTENNTLVGNLELVTFNADGQVVAGDAKGDAKITSLNQNVEKQVSVLVCLDGSDVTNANIMAEGNVVGTLNLQFSSSADLVPMKNSELMAGETANGGAEDDDAGAEDPDAQG